MMRYVMKEVNNTGLCTPLKSQKLDFALKEAEKIINDSSCKKGTIMGIWEADTKLNKMLAVWVPGRSGWTNF